jgi:hypothetical protein
MIKPSPPKKPPAILFWKNSSKLTVDSDARNADFCAMMERCGWA